MSSLFSDTADMLEVSLESEIESDLRVCGRSGYTAAVAGTDIVCLSRLGETKKRTGSGSWASVVACVFSKVLVTASVFTWVVALSYPSRDFYLRLPCGTTLSSTQ
jgi:hypothetical protein